jgi:hypothetical protein
MYGRIHAEAKQLLKAARQADPTAISTIRAAFPQAAPPIDKDLIQWLKLAQAQHAYAVSCGTAKWQDLLDQTKHSWATELAEEHSHELEFTDEFGSAIASTNAFDFVIDHTEVVAVEQGEDADVRIKVEWSATANDHREAPFCGNVINGVGTLVFNPDFDPYWDDVGAGPDDSWREEDDLEPPPAEPSSPVPQDGPNGPGDWRIEDVKDWDISEVKDWDIREVKDWDIKDVPDWNIEDANVW